MAGLRRKMGQLVTPGKSVTPVSSLHSRTGSICAITVRQRNFHQLGLFAKGECHGQGKPQPKERQEDQKAQAGQEEGPQDDSEELNVNSVAATPGRSSSSLAARRA